MRGAVLICGSGKKNRLDRAWELLNVHGFLRDKISADLLVIQREDEKKSIGIVQAKKIKEFMRQHPFEKKVKAVLVEEAQILTDDAQGSLLKVLEEPPAFGLIILLSDNEGSLLPTVSSRCQKIVLKDTGEKNKGNTYNLMKLSYQEIFDLAKEYSARGKEEAVIFLENILHEDVKSGVSPEVVAKTELALKDIKAANIALKFAVEYILLLHKVS